MNSRRYNEPGSAVECQYEEALVQPPREVLDINMGKYASGEEKKSVRNPDLKNIKGSDILSNCKMLDPFCCCSFYSCFV